MKRILMTLYKFIAFITTFVISMFCLILTIDFAATDALECYPHIIQFKIFCILIIGMWGLPILLLNALQSLNKKGKRS